MALDELKETIETLRERIEAHRTHLNGNEKRTRQVLIDPMLRALGWDVEDPNSVKLEYEINKKRVDYVLMGSEVPIVVVEAKTLRKQLDAEATDQVLNYATSAGIPYMTLTNGDHWLMLKVSKQALIRDQALIKDQILMEFQLTRDEPYACALQALRLWRPNLASRKPQEAATPVMIEKLARAESASTISEPSSESEGAELSNNGDWEQPTSWEDLRAWEQLISSKVEKNQELPKPPIYIKFPNSNQKDLKHLSNWIDILAEAAKYLVKTGKLSADDCPIVKPNSSLPLLDKTNERFASSKQIGNGLWLHKTLTAPAAKTCTERACWLLEKFGLDPSTVSVYTTRS